MTSRITNLKNTGQTAQDRQAGITLMLAVLMLSAITAIAFSLAAIVTIEIRNAGDNLRTEPALYSTLGVTELALMQYRRGIPASSMDVTQCTPSNQGICSINNVTLTPTKLTEDTTPRIQTIRPNERIVIPLYLPQQFDPQYGQIVFTVLQTRTNGVVDITIRETSITNVVVDYPSPVTPKQMNEFSVPWTFNTFNPDAQYEIILNNTGRPNPVTVSIETFGTNGQPKGIPFIDQQVLRVLSSYLGLTRTYIVKIPTF
jgi:hypothetical protein